ncbi:MAG: metallophosphoesterase [Syntrophaceae bacterium]
MMTINPRKKFNTVLVFLILLMSLLSMPGMGMGASLQDYLTCWKFAVISDTQGDNSKEPDKSGINDAVLQAIANDIVRENPDFVLVTGDLVSGWFRNGGTDYAAQYAKWKEAMSPVYNAGIRVYPVRGNHDSRPKRLALLPRFEPSTDAPVQLKNAFKDAFPEFYIPKNGPVHEEGLTYSFAHKNAFIVGLDQFIGGRHTINQEWLHRQLKGNSLPHVFVYGHEPAFETDHKDCLAFYPIGRDLFWDTIGRAGAKVYFCGHDHFYNRALIPDNTDIQIRQIIAGTGGGTLRKWSGVYKDDKRVHGEYHNSDHTGYILVTVEGTKATVIWKALMKPGTMDAWKILDTFTYSIPAEEEMKMIKTRNALPDNAPAFQ